jgi:hypothetical protein
MKYAIAKIPENAFIKISINQAARKVYFKDVKMFKKIVRAAHPNIPKYAGSNPAKEVDFNTDEDNSDDCCCGHSHLNS